MRLSEGEAEAFRTVRLSKHQQRSLRELDQAGSWTTYGGRQTTVNALADRGLAEVQGHARRITPAGRAWLAADVRLPDDV